MISGFEALQSIDRAYAQIREDEMRLDEQLRATSAEAARLRQEIQLLPGPQHAVQLLERLVQVGRPIMSTQSVKRA